MMRQLVLSLLMVQVVTVQVFDGGLIGELFRLPQLAEHFQEHRKESNGTMGFFEFLYLHYGDAGHRSEDSSHHSKLPFSSQHTHWMLQTEPPLKASWSDNTVPATVELKAVNSKAHKDSIILLSVWNPPDMV